MLFLSLYNKSKVEVCFNLGPLVMLTLVTRCPNQIKGNTFVCSNQTNSFPNVCNGLRLLSFYKDVVFSPLRNAAYISSSCGIPFPVLINYSISCFRSVVMWLSKWEVINNFFSKFMMSFLKRSSSPWCLQQIVQGVYEDPLLVPDLSHLKFADKEFALPTQRNVCSNL